MECQTAKLSILFRIVTERSPLLYKEVEYQLVNGQQ